MLQCESLSTNCRLQSWNIWSTGGIRISHVHICEWIIVRKFCDTTLKKGTNLIQNLFWSPELVTVAEKMKLIDFLNGKKTLPFFSYSSKFGNFLSTHQIFIPHICHRHHRQCLCKKFLSGVNFSRLSEKMHIFDFFRDICSVFGAYSRSF